MGLIIEADIVPSVLDDVVKTRKSHEECRVLKDRPYWATGM